MDAEKFIGVVKTIKQYAETQKSKLEYDSAKIQLKDYANKKSEDNTTNVKYDQEYEYITSTDRKLSYLQYLLHGAIKKIDNPAEYEDSVKNYIIHELKLLFGMYFFIDPSEVSQDNAKSHYVLGAVKENDPLKPSFSFPHFFNIKNFRRNAEFHLLPDEWQEFYTRVITLARGSIAFKEDFVKFFNDQEEGGGWRRCDKEIEHNFLYVSSGEIDHSILQWLFCSLIELKNFSSKVKDNSFKIALHDLYDLEILKSIFEDRSNVVVKQITVIEDGVMYFSNDGKDVLRLSLSGWLELFGLLENGFPTERLMAAIEFFYCHLSGDEKSNNYFSKEKTKPYYLRNSQTKDFTTKCEEYLPLKSKVYNDLIKGSTEEGYIDMKDDLLESYFGLLKSFANKNTAFKEYVRVPSLSPFFQRNIPPLYNSLLREQTCRGFIVVPTFSNPSNDNSHVNNYLKSLGYFLGVIKDSDSKGRCYFNWDKHSNTQTNSDSVKKFYSLYLFYLQNFVYTLGQNEVKQIYYKGIEERNKLEIKHQATRAAISQVMARNMSHNIGSHVMNNLTDGSILRNNEPFKCKAYNATSPKPLDKDEDSIINQLAIFNNYVKCRMDYLGDITFGTPVMHTTKKIEDVLKELDKVRLLLDNISGLAEKFQYSIKFANEYGDPNLSIALPNDLLGCQALYNIIENVIRNTAKHNHGKKEGEVTEFYVHFKEVDALPQDIIPDKDLWYQVEIYDTVTPSKDIDELVKEQNIKINAPVLGDDNQLRNDSLGLLEMEASAAYLRKLDIINVEHPDYDIDMIKPEIIHKNGKLNILKAFAKEVKVNNEIRRCLAYRFFVSKPTEFLFVGDFPEVNAERKSELLKQGVWFKTEAEFENELKEEKTVFNHHFILHISVPSLLDVNKDEKRKDRTRLPVRIIDISELTTSFKLLLKSKDIGFKKIEENVWAVWFDKIRGSFEVVNVITGYQEDTPRHNIPGRYNLVIQDHNNGNIWRNNRTDKIEKNVIEYLEPLSTTGQKTLPSFEKDISEYVYFEDWKELNGYKLFDAAISKILVIDERIQRYAESDYLNMPVSEIYSFSNVIVPNVNDLCLDATNFDKVLSSEICSYIDSKLSQIDLLLIHFGVLERMFKDDKKNIETTLREWAKLTKRVVVTSGRGKPKEYLPQEVCYVNLSPVMNVFIQNRSKYAINYLLNQARS